MQPFSSEYSVKGIQKVKAVYCFLYSTESTRSFFDVIPQLLHTLLLQFTSFLMPSVKNVLGCARSHICIISLTSSLFANWHPCNTYLSSWEIW